MIASLDTNAVESRVTDQIQIWCLDELEDSYLLLAHLVRFEDGKREPVRAMVLSIDRRGVRRMTPAMQTQIAEMDAVFDVLPELRPPAYAATVWRTPPDAFGRRRRCETTGPDATRAGHERVEYTVEDPTGVGGFLGEMQSGRFWFDPDGGVVSRVESERAHRKAGVIVQAKIKLRRRERLGLNWVIRRTAESREFLTTLDYQARLLRDVLARPDEIDLTVSRLERTWSSFSADVDQRGETPFRAIAGEYARRAAGAERSLREGAARVKSWVGHKAPDWTLQSPCGRTIRSAAIRRNVSVECYWSANSLWGLRSLELMRRVQQDVAGKPVTVICLNMDSDIELARRAVAACGNGLAHALAEPLGAGGPPMDFPTVRVLDRKGVVRHVSIGWYPNLSELLMPHIDTALAQR